MCEALKLFQDDVESQIGLLVVQRLVVSSHYFISVVVFLFNLTLRRQMLFT